VDSAALPQVARFALGFRSRFLGQSLRSSVGYNEKMAHPERGETITHSVQILKEPLANDHVQSVPGKIPPTFVCIFPSMQTEL
jgi:hypothetical protein